MGNGEWGMGGGEGHVAIAYTIKLKHDERLFFFSKFFMERKRFATCSIFQKVCVPFRCDYSGCGGGRRTLVQLLGFKLLRH